MCGEKLVNFFVEGDFKIVVIVLIILGMETETLNDKWRYNH